MIRKWTGLLLSFSLVNISFQFSFSYSDQDPTNFAQFNSYQTRPYLPEFNQGVPHLNLPALNFSFIPEFNLDARLPHFDVQDLNDRLWTFNNSSFNFDKAGITQFSSTINTPLEKPLSLEISGFKYDDGHSTPQSYKNVVDQKERSSQQETTNTSTKLYAPPTKELVRSFEETWLLDSHSSQGREKTKVTIQDMDYASGRWLSGYKGKIKEGNNSLSFSVTSPRDLSGQIQGIDIEIKAKGAPTAQIHWKPEGNSQQSFALLRDNLPVPLLVGPRSSLRLNGVDLSENPVKLDATGNLSSMQLAQARDLLNLKGHEKDGLQLNLTPPEPGSTQTGFSLGNAIRNLWYMLTGGWSEVKGMRKDLTALRDNQPEKFLLAAGFSDPSFMGIRDLRNAIGQIAGIDLSKKLLTQNESLKNPDRTDVQKTDEPISRQRLIGQAIKAVSKSLTDLFNE